MQKLVAVAGRVLSQVVSPTTVTCNVTEKNFPAQRCQGKSQAVLLTKIHLDCTFAGTAADGGVFSGNASGDIQAATPRVQCEDQSLLVEGQQVVITCNGKSQHPGSPPPPPVDSVASVTVTIASAGQQAVYANKP